MRLLIITALLTMTALATISLAGETPSATFVNKPGFVPYYTKLDAAMAAAKDGQFVVIDFYTDWCTWCKTLDTIVFVNDTTIEFFTNKMVLAKINAEVDTAVSNKYYAKAYPTTLLLNKSGEEVDRLVGYAPTQEYLKTLVDYSQGVGTLNDLLAKASAGSDRALCLQVADKYKYRGQGTEAQTWYTKVIETGNPHDSLSGEARMAFADFLRRDKKYDEAIAAFQKIEQEFTTYHGRDAVLWQAIVNVKKGDTAQAISIFESYVQRFPESEDKAYAQEQIILLKNPVQPSGK
jgi:thioredoxin-like negative regulator of GroEL